MLNLAHDNNLFAAITFAVAFQSRNAGKRVARYNDTSAGRIAFLTDEVGTLRNASGFATEAEFRSISSTILAQALAVEVNAGLRAAVAGPGFVVFYADSRVKPSHCKTFYKREGDARRAVERANARYARQGTTFAYSSVRDYVAGIRARVVFNMMSRLPVVEAIGTPNSCSVASETYWSM